MTERDHDRFRALEARVDRLSARLVVTELLFGAIAGLALQSIDEPLRHTILRGIRASISVTASGLAIPTDDDALMLQSEEHVAQLLDQIEGFARRKL